MNSELIPILATIIICFLFGAVSPIIVVVLIIKAIKHKNKENNALIERGLEIQKAKLEAENPGGINQKKIVRCEYCGGQSRFNNGKCKHCGAKLKYE